MCPTTMMVSKDVYTRSILEIVMQGPMLVGGVESWTTTKKIARLNLILKLVTEMA